MKSVVFTSSAWAAWTPGRDEKGVVLDEKSWNDEVVCAAATKGSEGIGMAGTVHWVWEGEHVEVLDMMEPQWHVDCRDVAKLYVALLATSPRVDWERILVLERSTAGLRWRRS